MSLILNIDTAADIASVCLAENEKVVGLVQNESRNDHASWLHPAIDALLKSNGSSVADLQAVAVNIGPGSFTGVRIGLSAAKGFCFATGIPLIAVSSLKILAKAVQPEAQELICPVIDARRMEVYTAAFDKQLVEKDPPQAIIIDENSFSEMLSSHSVLFCGNGCMKVRSMITHSGASFSNTISNASHLAILACHDFLCNKFVDTAYITPLYIKEFYNPTLK